MEAFMNMDKKLQEIRDDLSCFYMDNGIKHSVDGIGNEVWTYKDIMIAGYTDIPGAVTEVYCHWFVNKRDYYLRISPVKKRHNKYYHLNGNMFYSPWMDFDDYYADATAFKMALLESIKALEPRIQVLKGKITMIKKHRSSKCSNYDLVCSIDMENVFRLFRKERDAYKIKLDNGQVLPCYKLEDNLFSFHDVDAVYLLKYNCINNGAHFCWKNTLSISKKCIKMISEHC